jgi:hypothetical protein
LKADRQREEMTRTELGRAVQIQTDFDGALANSNADPNGHAGSAEARCIGQMIGNQIERAKSPQVPKGGSDEGGGLSEEFQANEAEANKAKETSSQQRGYMNLSVASMKDWR